MAEISLSSVRSKNYEANVNKLNEDIDTCFICGKRTISVKSVHYLTNGNLTDMKEANNSQGYFTIGNDCAKKIPNFIF